MSDCPTYLPRAPYERFWRRVWAPEDDAGGWMVDEHWFWMGAPNEWGYGKFRVSAAGPGSIVYAHRFAKLCHVQPVSRDLLACHAPDCGETLCVNPNHLRWDTPVGNAEDQGYGPRRRAKAIQRSVCATNGAGAFWTWRKGGSRGPSARMGSRQVGLYARVSVAL